MAEIPLGVKLAGCGLAMTKALPAAGAAATEATALTITGSTGVLAPAAPYVGAAAAVVTLASACAAGYYGTELSGSALDLAKQLASDYFQAAPAKK